MKQLSKTSILLASLLLLVIPLSTANAQVVPEDSVEITSTLKDGSWVNETLVINGSTTIPAQDANWVLFDITDPQLRTVLRSGEYFSEAFPVDDNLWIWSITIDVQGLNCTCLLEIGQPLGSNNSVIDRIIFIGDGPHNPVLSRLHNPTIVVDEAVSLPVLAILADSNLSESKIFLTWCYAPLGACEGDTFTAEAYTIWGDNVGVISLNATELGLEDGIWNFSYILQDMLLRKSVPVSVLIYVDQTDPSAVLVAPTHAFEGDIVLIDGSESRDDFWGGSLQAIWYVTQPDGTLRVAEQFETDGMVFTLSPDYSGNYTVQLDVVDMVGRRSSATVVVSVENIIPVIDLQMGDLDLSKSNSWELNEGDDLVMSASARDSGTDNNTLTYQWYLDDELFSTSLDIEVKDLDTGTHDLRLVVMDDDGAFDSHSMEITVHAKVVDDDDGLNVMAILLILAIFGVILVLGRRISRTDNEAVAMPKWETSSKSGPKKDSLQGIDENEVWNDSNTASEGKD